MMNFLLGFKFSFIMSKIISVQSMLATIFFGILGVLINKKKENIIFKIISIAATILLCGIVFLQIKGTYNTVELEKNPDYYYYGQEKDGKANGNGRIFDENGNKIYEGGFKQEQYHGEGKEYTYYVDGTTGMEKTFLEYEGEFYLGLRSGQGKLYNEYGKLLYEGGFAFGEKCGFGKEYEYDMNEQEDIKIIGVFYANGIYGHYEKYKDGKLINEGEYTDIVKYNIEYYDNGNVRIKGDYVLDAFTGNVTVYYEHGGKKYQGEFKNNAPHGNGVQYYEETGTKQYEGEFQNGKYYGEGKYYDKLGNLVYDGEFKNWKRHGTGTYYYESGDTKYEGEFQNGKYCGKGTLYYESGNLKYEGEFQNGKYYGEGTLYYESGNKKYEGAFINGKRHGTGTFYDGSGNLKYEGEWLNDEYVK
ncbi:MAG: hypothetical protein HDT40_09625 [Lachnospiraceae bacterium]|nr:hypothetical protein [Lachnospiraceae bacterium]